MAKNNIRLLDCTLRDGGYINDWHFGNSTIRSVVSRLDSAGIDIIEIGFLDDRVQYNVDKSIYPDIPSIERTLGQTSVQRAKLVAMIDYSGTFPSERLIHRADSVIDGIRLTFRKTHLDETIAFAQEILKRGYKLFLNPMSVTSYHDNEINDLIGRLNAIKPEAISIVDSYGLLYKKDFLHYINTFDDHLEKSISLGFHAHNNLQMANANSIDFIDYETKRGKIIDSSVLGMGRNAGNACTELILSYIEKNNIKAVDLNQILECAYTDIYRLYSKPAWGYHLEHLISAIHDCSHYWTQYLMNKYTLSIKDIRSIIASLPFERRLGSFFKKELAEQKYVEYMNNAIDDEQARIALKKAICGREILIICPGKSIETQRDTINAYIEKAQPVIITVNFISDAYLAEYVFISNPVRYSKMLGHWHDLSYTPPSLMLTSNITATDSMQPTFLFNYKTLYESAGGDNSAVLLLSLLRDIGIDAVSVAGLDGFDELRLEDNYYSFELSFPQAEDANARLIAQLTNILKRGMEINWITPSRIESMVLVNP